MKLLRGASVISHDDRLILRILVAAWRVWELRGNLRGLSAVLALAQDASGKKKSAGFGLSPSVVVDIFALQSTT
jgi:hypothetical protein